MPSAKQILKQLNSITGDLITLGIISRSDFPNKVLNSKGLRRFGLQRKEARRSQREIARTSKYM